MTAPDLIKIVNDFGFDGYSEKSESHIYAFSYDSYPGGHPKVEAYYSFSSGVLTVRSPKSSYERKVECSTHGYDDCPTCTGKGKL